MLTAKYAVVASRKAATGIFKKQISAATPLVRRAAGGFVQTTMGSLLERI